jgi:hypothetical protein
MLRKRIVGGHKKQLDTVVTMTLPSHEQGRGRTLLEEMLSNPGSPIEGYGGGGRQNIRLRSVDAAVDYLKDNDGDVPFGFD